MSLITPIISDEVIRKIIMDNDYIPEYAKKHMTTKEFESLYGLDALKNLKKGTETLEFLFGKKEHNENSLTYSLECNTDIINFYGVAAPGNATTKILNHSKGSWKNGRKNISETEAVALAEKIRNALINVLRDVDENTTAVDIYGLLEKENLPVGQNWLKKYLTILFPDKFMLMLNSDWVDRIFKPIGLVPEYDWFKDSNTFVQKAREYGVDGVSFYHVVYKCVVEMVKSELEAIGIEPDRLANEHNLLVNTPSAWNSVKKYIPEELQEKYQDYLSSKYGWIEKTTADKGESDVSSTTDSAINYKNKYSKKLIASKNIIFRGAPGTGKSYLAKAIAADIVSDGCQSRYSDLTDEQKERIGFVQFHPSYDYSDFVEGLRPVEKADKSLGFELRDGIFKEFVDRARRNFENSAKTVDMLEKELSAKEVLEEFLSHIEFDEHEFNTIKGKRFFITGYDDEYIHVTVPDNELCKNLKISISEICKMLEDGRVFENPKDVTNFFGRKHNTQEYSYNYAIWKEIFSRKKTETLVVPDRRIETEPLKNYVFIIDEINRGEISKILGELFFAIDNGYRGPQGGVSTQYSNLHKNPDEKFYIPENVYIIGTMNDIDRSVDTFDFAMRRRFRFIEIKADGEERDGMFESLKGTVDVDKVKNRMDNLNAEISKTEGLNSNYHIGAAYFLKLKEIKEGDKFEQLWSDHLQPLLQEYINGLYNEQTIMKEFKKAYNNEIVNKGDNDESI